MKSAILAAKKEILGVELKVTKQDWMTSETVELIKTKIKQREQV